MSEIKITKVTFPFDTDDGVISKSLKKPVDGYKGLQVESKKIKAESEKIKAESTNRQLNECEKKLNKIREQKATLLTGMLKLITDKLNAFIPVIKQGYSKKYDISLAKYNEQIGKYEEIMELKEKIPNEDSMSESKKLKEEFKQMAEDFTSAMLEIKTARSTLVNKMRKKLSKVDIVGRSVKEQGKILRAGIREFIYSALDTQKSEVYKLLSPVIKKKEDKKDE